MGDRATQASGDFVTKAETSAFHSLSDRVGGPSLQKAALGLAFSLPCCFDSFAGLTVSRDSWTLYKFKPCEVKGI